MDYFHVDVFSEKVLSGNGLTVVFCDKELDTEYMLQLTKELKQFETIFLKKIDGQVFQARIFTVDEELNFAGHPILGAAAVVHQYCFQNEQKIQITFQLINKTVVTLSEKRDGYYDAQMNQGIPQFIRNVPKEEWKKYVDALHLTVDDLSKNYSMEVVSTGLPYLLIPLDSGLEKARISCNHFEELLKETGAKFTYVFNINTIEGRTWDNNGNTEDVATGSAAGPVGAYLYKHKMFKASEKIILKQGRFVGRPSEIKICRGSGEEIIVSGSVTILAKGTIFS